MQHVLQINRNLFSGYIPNAHPLRVERVLDEWRREVQLRSAEYARLLLLGAIGAIPGRIGVVGDLAAKGKHHPDVGRMLVVLDPNLGFNEWRTEEEVDRVRAAVERVACMNESVQMRRSSHVY
jgi:hypothetical protein